MANSPVRIQAADSSNCGPLGASKIQQQVREMVSQVAAFDTLVLIQGESGSGKEVVARAVHNASPRQDKPFVPVNCGAIPADLLESELFGHEKGAFTGAISARKGRFEMAEGGTLFLDEIGDMSFNMQVKLLRVLQERCFERVGSNQTIHCNVRIIAATHRDLPAMIEEGKLFTMIKKSQEIKRLAKINLESSIVPKDVKNDLNKFLESNPKYSNYSDYQLYEFLKTLSFQWVKGSWKEADNYEKVKK